MNIHCPFGLYLVGPCTNWSFVQLDHLLIGRIHSPPKMNWTELAQGQPRLVDTYTWRIPQRSAGRDFEEIATKSG